MPADKEDEVSPRTDRRPDGTLPMTATRMDRSAGRARLGGRGRRL